MTISSRNPGVRNLIAMDGEDETKAFIKEHYGLDDSLESWKDIDDAAEKAQAVLNEQFKQNK